MHTDREAILASSSQRLHFTFNCNCKERARVVNFRETEPGVVTLWNTTIGDGVKSRAKINAAQLSPFPPQTSSRSFYLQLALQSNCLTQRFTNNNVQNIEFTLPLSMLGTYAN